MNIAELEHALRAAAARARRRRFPICPTPVIWLHWSDLRGWCSSYTHAMTPLTPVGAVVLGSRKRRRTPEQAAAAELGVSLAWVEAFGRGFNEPAGAHPRKWTLHPAFSLGAEMRRRNATAEALAQLQRPRDRQRRMEGDRP